MSALVGQYSLALAVMMLAGGLFAALAALRFDSPAFLRAARGAILGYATLLSLSAAALLWALIQSDFSIAYVAEYTERALPLGYKIAAFWAGQEGSILLWAWLLAMMSVVVVLGQWKQTSKESAVATALLAIVCGFFAVLLLFAANPFEPAATPAADGHGLNPMLQNLAMIIHPPLLFMGYAGFGVPWALLLGALLTGQTDGAWLRQARPWILFSWLFLSLGILLGAQWAYVELGWGGYWAWDPVENASLLPWLTGTALLHSAAGQRRGFFKRWTASLVALTFILCVFGTYLTRSGVVQSVHAFGESLVGRFFLGFLAVLVAGSVLSIILRLGLLKAERKVEELCTREGFFLAANVLLVLMMLVTLVGTVLPLLSGPFLHEPLSVGGPFYNKAVLPLALVVAAIMAAGPVVHYGNGAALRARRSLQIIVGSAAAGAGVMLLLGVYNPWALASAAVVTAVATGITLELLVVIRLRRTVRPENFALAAFRVLQGDHQRWGVYLTHFSLALIIVGVAGSSLYNANQTFQLQPGKSGKLGTHTITFVSLEELRHENYSAVQANVTLTDAHGQQVTLHPERRFYDKGMEQGQSASEVAIRWSLAGDIYVSLAGWEKDGQNVAIQVILNPLVDWIWIGGILLGLGAAVCLMPHSKTPQPVSAKDRPATALPIAKPALD